VRGSEDEIADLAASLNRMAVQMEERLRAITRQKNEQAAVLEGMVEGVLAVDREERVLRMNGAAARLLGVAPEAAAGRSLQEVVRSVELQRLVRQVLAGGGAAECEFVLYGEQERHIECHCTVPPDPSGAGPGALVVLHDITRLKRLEAVRRDFVANVSHELKTPITAIQGCADTLLDGGASGPEETRRFLEMLRRHAGRLASIVEDLLRLSRIESDAEHGRIATEPGCVAEVLRSAVRSLGPAAAARRIALAVECPDRMPARINASLLEQAVGNLVDNAVKYAPEGSRVLVSGIEGEREVEIRVSDEGPGIERKHLPRLFERFYRVDPARSRAGGGTGLGLAIVKHIAQAHRGSVGVESAPGRGSSFFIRIPRQS
jgi:two-component system phosphate regulon sensor histidine kinase PhoR